MENMGLLLFPGLSLTKGGGGGRHSPLPQCEITPDPLCSQGQALCPPAWWDVIYFAKKDMLHAKPKNKNSLAKISHQSWLFFKNLQKKK